MTGYSKASMKVPDWGSWEQKPHASAYDEVRAAFILHEEVSAERRRRNQFRNEFETNQRSNEMNTNEMITIMQLEGGAKVVRAEYLDPIMEGRTKQGNNGYHFKNVLGLELKEGDMVVCETRDTFALLTILDSDVMATDVGCPLGNLKHVVAKVRNDAFTAAKKSEHDAHRKLALSEVTAKLDTYRKQVGEGAFGAVAGLLGMTQPEDAVLDTAGTEGRTRSASDDVIDDGDAK